MKELTREELPTDGTHFVVTWVNAGEDWCEVGKIIEGDPKTFSEAEGGFGGFAPESLKNVRYWQFPEGETK